jgi:alkanesulfonate monooxygenase SsuD/methylene tetrahydromethanopterin reductase-like flavin-dependent oxidoreductase (luciferase family)
MSADVRARTSSTVLPVTFGVRLPNSGPFAEPSSILAVANAADALGFDALWVHDHIPWAKEMVTHFSTGSIEACEGQDPNFFETITTVTYLAGLFPNIDVGIAGLVLPLRDPRVLAKQLMTTQSLTGGRLITALAIGNIPNDFDVMQVPFKRRGRITDEHLAALATIYDDQRSGIAGDAVAFEHAEFFPKPADRRFWIAGNSPPAYRRIADHGTGWLPGGLSPTDYRRCLDEVAVALEARDRTVSDLHRGTELYLCIADTTEEAVAISARSLEHRFKSVEAGVDRNIIGSPADVLEKVEAFRQAGVTHFELRLVGHTLASHLEMLELFRRDVLPHAERAAAF